MKTKYYVLLILVVCFVIYFATKKRAQEIIEVGLPPAPAGANTEMVFIANCANPWNDKSDIELMDQHNGFINFFLRRGISCGSIGSASLAFDVPAYQFDIAKKYLVEELKKNPNRWNKLTFRESIIGK